jgi:hypothetical protein
MSHQVVFQKLANGDFSTESDYETMARWETSQMEVHDAAIDRD